MKDKPRLSILTPWRDRDELGITLAANGPLFRTHDAEILVLNCGGNSEQLRGLIAASEVSGVRQLDISVSKFNKSLAFNIGLAYAKADTIFTLDADIILLDPLPMDALDGHSFATVDTFYESVPPVANQNPDDPPCTPVKSGILEFTFRGGVKVRHQFSVRDANGTARSQTGHLLARKSDLLEIQGYNSELEGWGWEDDDILVRLQHVLGLRRIPSGTALHLTHGDDRRTVSGSRRQSDQRNFLRCCRNYNNGLFLGTYLSDLAKVSQSVCETHSGAIARIQVPPGPTELSGPEYCGSENGSVVERAPEWTGPAPSVSEKLLEAALAKAPLDNACVLQVGSGGPGVDRQLSSRCRHVTCLVAAAVDLPNYSIVVCDPFGESFREWLPLRTYDAIIDYNIASHACCQRHLRTLLQNYSSLLASNGWLTLAGEGTDGAAEANLVYLADECGLCVMKPWFGIYRMTRDSSTARFPHIARW